MGLPFVAAVVVTTLGVVDFSGVLALGVASLAGTVLCVVAVAGTFPAIAILFLESCFGANITARHKQSLPS